MDTRLSRKEEKIKLRPTFEGIYDSDAGRHGGWMYAEAIRERKGGVRMGRKKGRSNIYAPILSKTVTSFCQSRHIPWSKRSQAQLHGHTEDRIADKMDVIKWVS